MEPAVEAGVGEWKLEPHDDRHLNCGEPELEAGFPWVGHTRAYGANIWIDVTAQNQVMAS